MSTRSLELAALAIWSAAWVITAALLGLDLLGRLPFKRRRDTRAFRLQSASALPMETGAILTQVADLRNWPRPVLEALHATDILLALAFGIGVVIAASIKPAGDREREIRG